MVLDGRRASTLKLVGIPMPTTTMMSAILSCSQHRQARQACALFSLLVPAGLKGGKAALH